MRDRHEPRDEFIDRLAGQLRVEMRRRTRAGSSTSWTRWPGMSPLKIALATAVLVIVSMAIGGIAVVAAYQARGNEQRSALAAGYEQRVSLAQQRVALAASQVRLAEQRTATGTDTQEQLLDARFAFAEASAQLRKLESELTEVQASGQPALTAVSSPLVSGHDYVTDRWSIDLTVPIAAIEFEKARLQTLERRVAVGAASQIEVATSRARIGELQATVAGLEKRMDIRQRFLKREMDAKTAELRVLENEAEQRRQTLAPRLDLARAQVRDLQARVEIGTAASLDVAQARLRLQELELELSKAEVDLAAIRRQLEQLRGR